MTELKKLLMQVAEGEITPEDAELKLKMQPFEDMGFAKPDFHRGMRQGASEVIYGEGKTAEQIAAITRELLLHGQKGVLITRMSGEKAKVVGQEIELFYDSTSRIGIAGEKKAPVGDGKIVIATGGTSDMPVAEEAALTAEFLGNHVVRLIVAIAGMEGALASVVGGLADCPVIAVPTSVGYGASFGGVSALLSMLNSCASGVSVVNIDNGFGAGYLASMINQIGK